MLPKNSGARLTLCSRKICVEKNQIIFFFKFELFEFVQTCCDVGEPRSQSARTFPARARHKTPDVDEHVSLEMSQNGAFGPEIVQIFHAKIREVVAFFLRHRSRNALKRRPASLQKLERRCLGCVIDAFAAEKVARAALRSRKFCVENG